MNGIERDWFQKQGPETQARYLALREAGRTHLQSVGPAVRGK